MRGAIVAAASASALLLAAGPAGAGEVIAGVYAHDVTFLGEAVGLGAAGKEGGANIHLGWRSDRIDAAPDCSRQISARCDLPEPGGPARITTGDAQLGQLSISATAVGVGVPPTAALGCRASASCP